MERLFNLTAQSLNNYFDILETQGYLKDRETFNILALTEISKFVEEFKDILTEADLYNVQKAIDCIENSCMISRNDCTNCIIC